MLILKRGGDFYNSFVLGFYPASFDADLIDDNTVNITAPDDGDADSDTDLSAASATGSFSAAASTVPAAEPTSTENSATCIESWQNSAYPNCPDVAQPNLGIDGVVSGKIEIRE